MILAGLMLAGCGGAQQLGTGPSASVPSVASGATGGGTFRTASLPEGPTYVGPIRLPISVHGTTVQLSWLGNDEASRGYELVFERYDVSNVWQFALHDVVAKPEAKEYLGTEGTYRVKVRGLFGDGFEGGYTDWQVFSTDGHNTPAPPAPVVLLPPVDPCLIADCPPPPPPPVVCEPNEHIVDGVCVHNGDGDGNGNGQGDDNGNGGGNGNTPPPPGPPAFVDVDFCHAEFHKGHGGHNPVADFYTYQDKTAHSQSELDQHIGQHANDYLGVCVQ
jgi:hypothetical protein